MEALDAERKEYISALQQNIIEFVGTPPATHRLRGVKDDFDDPAMVRQFNMLKTAYLSFPCPEEISTVITEKWYIQGENLPPEQSIRPMPICLIYWIWDLEFPSGATQHPHATALDHYIIKFLGAPWQERDWDPFASRLSWYIVNGNRLSLRQVYCILRLKGIESRIANMIRLGWRMYGGCGADPEQTKIADFLIAKHALPVDEHDMLYKEYHDGYVVSNVI
jgi:hypothetical protein